MRIAAKIVVAVLFTFGLLPLSPASSAVAAKVKAWQGTITIPTYPWEEDPYPKFWAIEESPKLSTTVKGAFTYPYRMQDHLLRTKVDRTYKALFLENEYLKVTCLPELGGRLHSVYDKTEGKEMFHLNRVIKPGMIALRGAFISGGVEWNAGPQGHTVTIVSPVDALTGENPDGSAYIEINNQEMIFRTRWTVRVTLHPGRSYLDEQIRIANPTDNMTPYYFWNCTAFPNRPGTRFIYPMRLGTGHYGRKFFNWPVHEGKDLSWLKNWETWGSVFAVGCDQDFFGAYDVEADRGIVQVANHRELPGKKAWTWGNWEFGRVAQQNLTDEDGPYIEVQSGPLPTQSDYGLLGPRDQVAWQEWWYPVHGLGDGFEYANRDVAVQVARKNGKLQLRIIATGEFPGATCVLEGGDEKSAWMTKDIPVDLSPSKAQLVERGKPRSEPVGIWIRTKDRRLLAHFKTPLPMKEVTPPTFVDRPDEQLGVEELYLKGEKFYREINRRAARTYFDKALAKDPGFVPALRMSAVMDLGAGLPKKAVARLKKAVARQPDDGLSWYFLGAANLRLDDPAADAEALDCGYRAARCSNTTAIGYDLAGRAHMRLRQPAEAIAAFRKSLAANPRDYRAKDHLLLALYAGDKRNQALEEAKKRIADDPTDLVPRALLALENDKAMQESVKEIKGCIGEYDFNMVETSLVFADVGMLREAGHLLYAACADSARPKDCRTLAPYYLAYFARTAKKDSKGLSPWEQAALNGEPPFGPSAYDLYPSRPEELAVMQYVVAHHGATYYAHFALGNLLAHLGRVDEAISHWENGVAAAPAFGRRFRNLPFAIWKWKGDLKRAEDIYRDMFQVYGRTLDQTLYRDFAEILLAAGKRPEAIKVMKIMPTDKPRRSEITIMLAQAYLDEKRYDDAIKLLESTPNFVNWEGQDVTWRLFNRAHVCRGQERMEKKDFTAALADFEAALTYPPNLNVGRSNTPEESPALYWKGKALAALGRDDDARAAWKQGAALPEGKGEQARYRKLCQEQLKGTD